MTISAKKRAANNKWDKENMTMIGCRVRKTYAQQIKERCKKHGIAPATILRKAIDDFMLSTEEQETETEQEATEINQ